MNDDTSKKIVLVGAPLDLGAKNLGVEEGPKAFRQQEIDEKLRKVGLNVEDVGDVEVKDRADLTIGDTKLRYLDEIVRVSEELAKISEDAIKSSKRIIAVGGDHSINLGVVSGASKALNGDLGLIYLDAHGDMNTAETTLSGNIHGMHLASLMGFGAKRLSSVASDQVKINKTNLLHIGGSDFDQAEIDFIKQEDLTCFTLFDLLSFGLSKLIPMIEDLSSRVSNIWISLDLDVIDRVYAPGAGMPNPAGLTYREIAAIAEYIGKHCSVIGIDVVEYNPFQDVDNKTAELGIELIAKFLGTNYSWYTNYMERNKLG